MARKIRIALATLFLVSVCAAGSLARTKVPESVTITLTPSVGSPQFLGTSIVLHGCCTRPEQRTRKYDYQFAAPPMRTTKCRL